MNFSKTNIVICVNKNQSDCISCKYVHLIEKTDILLLFACNVRFIFIQIQE